MQVSDESSGSPEALGSNSISPVRNRNKIPTRKIEAFVIRGAIEDYYPDSVTGQDKPSMAMDFCKRMSDSARILELCGDVTSSDGKKSDKEFNVIFSSIFESE